MAKVEIPIGGGWMPDLPYSDVAKAGGLVVAKNILPVNRGYLPVFGKSVFNDTALSGTPINGTYAQDTDGQYYNYVGTATKLYRFSAGTLTDISKAATTYSGTTWNFAEYGTWEIATNFAEAPQVLKGFTAANFIDLGGSPPKAKYCLMNNTMLVLGYLNDGTIKPKELRWSAIENPESWPSGYYQPLPDMLGNMSGLGALGRNYVISAENSLSMGFFVGGRDVYEFDINRVRGYGAFYPQTFISIDTDVFFWGKDSIYRYNGSEIEDIGQQIKTTVMADINTAYLQKITVAHDRRNSLVMWLYPTQASTGTPDRMLVYNYLEKRWTFIGVSGHALFMAVTGGQTADSLTTTLIDSLNILIDSNYWLASNIQPVIVDDSNSKVSTFSGSSLECEIETGEIADLPKMLNAQKVYPSLIGNGATGSYVIKHRASDEEAQSSSSSYSTTASKTTHVSVINKKLAVNLKSSNFVKVGNHIDVDIVQRGGR